MKKIIVLLVVGFLLASAVLAASSNALLVRAYRDNNCNRYYDSTDTPLGDVTVAVVFPDGSFASRQTRSHGMALFRLSDTATRVALAVLPENMTPCVPGGDVQEIEVAGRFQFVQVGFQPVATNTAGVVLP